RLRRDHRHPSRTIACAGTLLAGSADPRSGGQAAPVGRQGRHRHGRRLVHGPSRRGRLPVGTHAGAQARLITPVNAMTRIGRFAPSPTGPLHAGSLVAALASWLDVRARGPQARWLVRIEDADTERCLPGMGELILSQLAACAMIPDETPVWQTRRTSLYEHAFEQLQAAQVVYP